MFSSGWLENTAIKPTTASHANTISVWLNEWLLTHSLTHTHVDDFLSALLRMSFGGVEGRFLIIVQPHMPVLSVQEPREYVRAEVESEDARAEAESVLGALSDVLILLLFLAASLALL